MLVESGRVTVDGAPGLKPATLVGVSQALAVIGPSERWASRGAYKLLGALEKLDVEVRGHHCLDAGASTGGFTDVLLDRGAARVVAVDVGYGQLAWRLRTDPRVLVLDRTNIRHLDADAVPPPACTLVVADLSFISLTAVLPALRQVADDRADFLLMVKPQFEVGAGRVGKGGVVRDPAAWAHALCRVRDAAAEVGLGLVGATPSPLPGPSGNVEFFLHLRTGARPPDTDLLDAAVRSGLRISGRETPLQSET